MFLDVLRLAVGRADGIGEGRRRKHSKAQDDSRERPYQRVHKQQCPNKTCNAEACLIMYMKCKQVPSKAMQLQVHPGSVTKAQDVKGLGWLAYTFPPGRQPASCLTMQEQNFSPLDLRTTGLPVLLCREGSFKNYFGASTTGPLP